MADPLRKELQALARDLQAHGIPLIVGGGYGLLLRTEMIQRSGARTLRTFQLPGPPKTWTSSSRRKSSPTPTRPARFGKH